MDINIITIGLLVGFGIILAFAGGYYVADNYNSEDDLEPDTTPASPPTAVLQHVAAAVIERNKEGKITFCSPYTEVLTGYSLKEIFEAPEDFFLTICPAEHRERIFRSLKISELSGEPFQFQFPFHHKSGIEMWAESRVVPLFDSAQEVCGTIAVTLDVTAMVLQQKLVEQKNSELKEFTSIVSHDLKAPIYTINGLINVIKEDFTEELPASALEIFSTIEHAGRRLEQLVQAILDYARLGVKEFAMEPQPLDIVFEDVLAEHHHALEAQKVQLSKEPLPEVLGDRSALIQIFSNLIGNAIKYRKPEVPLSITIRSISTPTPKQIKIQIEDNGIGIPADRVLDVFKPFVRIHEHEVEGSGIGLATVKKLVERFGGSVYVESVSTGSVFNVILRTP
jgi:PAS domain S-box-containing protein